MHIIFTDEEQKYIDKKSFNWTIKENCPEGIKVTLEKKFKELFEFNNTKETKASQK